MMQQLSLKIASPKNMAQGHVDYLRMHLGVENQPQIKTRTGIGHRIVGRPVRQVSRSEPRCPSFRLASSQRERCVSSRVVGCALISLIIFALCFLGNSGQAMPKAGVHQDSGREVAVPQTAEGEANESHLTASVRLHNYDSECG